MKTILTSTIEEKCAWFGSEISHNNDLIIKFDDYLLSVLDEVTSAYHQFVVRSSL